MSPILTLQGEDVLGKTKSFQIINNDDLSTLTTPESKAQFTKPNVNIVKPIQRKMLQHNTYEREIFHTKKRTKENKTISQSQPILNDDFSRQLEQKLNNLKNDFKRSNMELSSGGNSGRIEHKKPFVTTVRKGEFLRPDCDTPASLRSSYNNRKVYAYESKPKVFGGLLGAAKKLTQISAKVAGVNLKRDVPGRVPYMNLMYERRVVRGSNYAQAPFPSWNPNFGYARSLGSTRGDGESQACKEAMLRKKEMLKKSKGNTRGSCGGPYPLGEPPAVKNRKHEAIQTEIYLEELFDRPPDYDVACQTDLFLCRPATPPYIPPKTGIDAYTEILPGELWDFDLEVQPILECLVGKTLEQALMEVLEDEELQSLREQQERIIEHRETERAEARRLEQEERRLALEKERRLSQKITADKMDRDTRERVTAAMLLQGHIENILPDVLHAVPCGEGITGFTGEATAEWLTKEVALELGRVVDSREVLEEIVREIVETRAEIYRVMNEPCVEDLGVEEEQGEAEVELEECKIPEI